jgi:hypothetical protein
MGLGFLLLLLTPILAALGFVVPLLVESKVTVLLTGQSSLTWSSLWGLLFCSLLAEFDLTRISIVKLDE